ncbi:hypothetical protein EI94DRAFT_905997 [Lactarius quietus]|nr:hypothetical protein EI94DRAFT_905997 [Lactarius quietus]
MYKIKKKYESEKSDAFDSTLSGGLCRIVNASGPAVGMSQLTDCHSTTDVGGPDTTFTGLLSNASIAFAPLTLGIVSYAVVSTPSERVFDDGSPSRRLRNLVGEGVRRLSVATSKGNEEKDDWVDVGMPSPSPGRSRTYGWDLSRLLKRTQYNEP